MKKSTIWLKLATILVVLLVFSGCESDLPVRYPEIELPPANGQTTTAVIDDIIEVPASELWHKTIEIPSKLEGVKLAGWCTASGGARNDIKVLVLNDIDFHNYRNFGKVKGLYESEKTTVDNFTAELKTPGKYHLVISNWFSEFSTKKVIAKVYLYWSVPPVEYKISADGMGPDGDIPAGANVTFTLTVNVSTTNFTITSVKDGITIPFTANKTGVNLWFIAPPVDDYRYTCENCDPKIEGKFSISEPIIGKGYIVSSSMANAPPNIEVDEPKPIQKSDILVNSTILNIMAEDPDDDDLTFYAFNLPMSVNRTDNKGRRIWVPAATLDEKTGVLKWNESSAGLATGNYTVRFEVTDGILSDYQDVVIEIIN